MALLSYRRHLFPPVVIQHAVSLYLRFTLRYRDVQELLAERGLAVSYETVRRWVVKFGPIFAFSPASITQGHLGAVSPGVFGRIRLDLVLACLAPHDQRTPAATVSPKPQFQLSPDRGTNRRWPSSPVGRSE